MKNCRQCGSFIEDDDIYCPRCGYKNSDEDKIVTEANSSEGTEVTNNIEDIDENKTKQINTSADVYNNSSYSAYSSTIPQIKKEISPLCIIGFILTFFGGSIISLILCIIGVVTFDESKQTGKGFGIAGIIINSIIIAVTVIIIIAVIISIGGAVLDEFYW